jgi:hypothetical protein
MFARHAAGSIWCRQSKFAKHGISAGGSEPSASARVKQGRMLASLESAGLIVRSKAASRATGARLTPEGYEIIGALCGLPGAEDCFKVMREMVAIGETDEAVAPPPNPSKDHLPVVRETTLIGEPEYRNDDNFKLDLAHLQKCLALALHRGWVLGHSDVKRHVCYQLTAAGVTMLNDDHEAERRALIDVERPEPKDAANELWRTVYMAEKQARLSWDDEQARGEIGSIPMSCSSPTVAELRAFHEETELCKRLNLHCPKCGGRLLSGIIPNTSPREAQCWREECRHRFVITEPEGAAK